MIRITARVFKKCLYFLCETSKQEILSNRGKERERGRKEEGGIDREERERGEEQDL